MKYIVVDLEATCWESNKDHQMEIIEIGAVRLDEQYNMMDKFQSFVKPILNPIVSNYCKQLTTIKQEDVDSALGFTEVLSLFDSWLFPAQDYINGKVPAINDNIFCSWGKYDRNQLVEDCILHKCLFPFNNAHINIKKEFAEIMKHKHCGVGKALNILNMKREGPAHRALSDAINIAKIFKRIKTL